MNMKAAAIAIGGLLLATTAGLADDQKQTSPMSPNSQSHQVKPSSQTEGKGQMQPQGQTGQTNTGSGGVTASSPQGETPPAMQPDPKMPEPNPR